MITKDYILKSSTGAVVRLSYYVNGGHWQKIEIEQLPEGKTSVLASIIPVTVGSLNQFREQYKGKITIEELPPDLSFKTFWNAYAYKRHKGEAEEQWGKLTDEEKMSALTYIRRYNQRCMLDKTAKVHARRYLRRKLWKDEE